jgi:hypothetical protein
VVAASLAACGSESGSDKLSKTDQTTSSEAPMSMSNANAKIMDGFATADTDSTAAPSPSTSGIADNSTPSDFNRQVIYTADLHMQVKDFASTRLTIDQLITSSGGYLLSFTEDESSDRKSGSFKIKVPAKGFNTFIDAIDKLPDKKLSKSINGEDVTEEYADLNARLKAKEVAEARLLSFMENAKTSKDLVAFSNELSQVQEDIERIKGRMRFIDQNVEYSTVNINMYQTLRANGSELDLNEKPGLMTRAGNALNQSADMIVELGKAIVIAAAFLLPLMPVIGAIILIVFMINRRIKRTKSQTSNSPQQNDPTPPSDDQMA